MITINDTLHTNADTAMLKAICPDTDSICFFDIETTGFSRNYNIVYLIGAVYFRNGITHYLQWLAESDSDEAYILSAFNDFLKDTPQLTKAEAKEAEQMIRDAMS